MVIGVALAWALRTSSTICVVVRSRLDLPLMVVLPRRIGTGKGRHPGLGQAGCRRMVKHDGPMLQLGGRPLPITSFTNFRSMACRIPAHGQVCPRLRDADALGRCIMLSGLL